MATNRVKKLTVDYVKGIERVLEKDKKEFYPDFRSRVSGAIIKTEKYKRFRRLKSMYGITDLDVIRDPEFEDSSLKALKEKERSLYMDRSILRMGKESVERKSEKFEETKYSILVPAVVPVTAISGFVAYSSFTQAKEAYASGKLALEGGIEKYVETIKEVPKHMRAEWLKDSAVHGGWSLGCFLTAAALPYLWFKGLKRQERKSIRLKQDIEDFEKQIQDTTCDLNKATLEHYAKVEERHEKIALDQILGKLK